MYRGGLRIIAIQPTGAEHQLRILQKDLFQSLILKS